MYEPCQSAIVSDACLIAANHLRCKLNEIAKQIECADDPSIRLLQALPVDVFLTEMQSRKRAPRIAFRPKRLGHQLWTESLTAYVCAGIERAFFQAGSLPGGDRSGYVSKLKDLQKWTETQLGEPEPLLPDYFIQKTSHLFRKGILKDRRRERIDTLIKIEQASPNYEAALHQLKSWIEEDLLDEYLRQRGRPAKYKKIMIAAEIANLWNILTGRKMSKGPHTNFAQFVTACWESGFDGKRPGSNFKRVLRYHILEDPDAKPCGKCESCEQGFRCERTRYCGTLK